MTRPVHEVIAAYQRGDSMTDQEVKHVVSALRRLHTAVLEVGNDVNLVLPWLIPKLHSFESFHKHRQERKQQDDKKNWGPWLDRRFAPYPYQTWDPFPGENPIVEVSFSYTRDEENTTGPVSAFFWGFGSDASDPIRRCRRWIGEGKPGDR